MNAAASHINLTYLFTLSLFRDDDDVLVLVRHPPSPLMDMNIIGMLRHSAEHDKEGKEPYHSSSIHLGDKKGDCGRVFF